MASKINATTTNGLVMTSDASGVLEIQFDGTTIATVSDTAFTLASVASIVGGVSANQLTGTLPGSVFPSTLPAVNGSALTGVGHVLQTVYKKVDSKSTYSVATAGQTGTYIAVLDTTITPTSTSSKILINFNITYEVHNDTVFRLYRRIGGTDTEILRNSTDGNYWAGWKLPGHDANTDSTPWTNHLMDIDSPNTTSAVTYRLMIQSGGVGAVTFYLNRSQGSAGQGNYEVGTSSVILQELGY